MHRLISVLGGVALGAAVVVSAGTAGRTAGGNVVADPGFESGGTATWKQCGTESARVSTSQPHSGRYDMRAGSTNRTSGEIDGDEGLCQRVTIPANGVLTFWVNGFTNETSTEYSYQEAELLDDEGNTLSMLWQASVTTGGWAKKTVDVSRFAGQNTRLYFGVHGNGFAKAYTMLYVDDVDLRSAPGGGTPAPTAPPTLGTPSPLGTPTPGPTPAPVTAAPATGAASGGAMLPDPAGPSGSSCGNHCGSERWHVKTMSDPQATSVNKTIKVVTVDTLIHAPVPVPASGSLAKADNVRFGPWELQAVQIRATIVGWKTENDNDFHIVVADLKNPSETMIVEPPSSACSSACSSGYGSFFQASRDAFTKCLGQPSTSFTHTNAKTIVADITGVPYFDPIHGQTGVAPNGIEIHPVINVTFVSGC